MPEITVPARFEISQTRANHLRRIRGLKDKLAAVGIELGGVSVIIAILLMLIYLTFEVLPLFAPAETEQVVAYGNDTVAAPNADTQTYKLEEQSELAAHYHADGLTTYFQVVSGEEVSQEQLAIPQNTNITSYALDGADSNLFAWGLSDGSVLVAEQEFKVTYGKDAERLLTPKWLYPYGQQPISLVEGERISTLAIGDDEEQLTLVALTADNQIYVKRFSKEQSLFADEPELIAEPVVQLTAPVHGAKNLMLGNLQRWLYVPQKGSVIQVYDLKLPGRDKRHSLLTLQSGSNITASSLLLGGISLIVGQENGQLSQLFMVRDDNNHYTLQEIRQFELSDAPITVVTPEPRRKVFFAGDENGMLGIFNTTAHRELLKEQAADSAIQGISVSPRGNGILVQSETSTRFLQVDNEHPDISWSALWGKVWYENYQEPEYIWQSSSASNDFEPKFSLMPLAFGTLKAAFYAMLIAIPLAICGAMYTSYFMAPKLRMMIKPTIEMMEALPTVILGFLAGLWLAPAVENNLPGIFSMLILTPVVIILFGLGWSRLPLRLRAWVPDGWMPVLLVPAIIFAVWFSLFASPGMENLLFEGDMRAWISQELGIAYDQRNAMVVGFAMGFAVIPTIFSIAEDALFGVPKSLSYGSLALGATQWQTMVRVILPTASPGIFSGVMIGFGRAVGETMIVLMATGNTPIMDMNIFEGLRTLSANIAVEMPEAEVDSTHFRILFLAALVLFIFTFMVNTLAELIRQRLRGKYGSL